LQHLLLVLTQVLLSRVFILFQRQQTYYWFKKRGGTFSWFERKGQGHSQVGLVIACASRRVSQEDFYLSGRPSTRFAVKQVIGAHWCWIAIVNVFLGGSARICCIIHILLCASSLLGNPRLDSRV
jgi:hypothetical protein